MASPISLYVGEQAQLNANITPAGTGPVGRASEDATWTTSNAGVVSFFQYDQPVASVTGTPAWVRGMAAGTATITLTVGSFTDTLAVTVSANREVNIAGVSITVGAG